MPSFRNPLLVLGLGIAALPLGPLAANAQKKQRDLITREEILASAKKDQDLFAAIKSLRPRFLDPPRGVHSLNVGASVDQGPHLPAMRGAGQTEGVEAVL